MSTPSSRSSQLRVAVIGGGVIGLACALELRARGADVAVYERGTEVGGGATTRAAGMLAAAFEWGLEREQLALAALARSAGEMWPAYAAKVERLGGGTVEFSAEGSVVVARTVAEMVWLEDLAAACQARDLPVRRLTVGEPGGELGGVEGAVTGAVRGALLLPGDRQVDPQLLLVRMAAGLARVGVGLKLGRMVDRVVGVGVGPVLVMPDGERVDRVVLATGAAPAAVKFNDAKGRAVETGLAELVPVKGHMLALARVDGGPTHVVHARDVYIAPKARWTLVGATSERGKADVEVDRQAIAALRTKAAALIGSLANAPEVSAWAGVRPGTPDDAPMIGATAIPGVFAALGCYRNGILFAPAVAELVADMVIDGKVSARAAAFDPLRFDKAAKAPHSP